MSATELSSCGLHPKSCKYERPLTRPSPARRGLCRRRLAALSAPRQGYRQNDGIFWNIKKLMKNTTINRAFLFSLMLLGLSSAPPLVQADEDSDAISRCLKAWGKHPFGNNPSYRTLATSVKVFGIGQDTEDTQATSRPELVMVNTGVNVMGGSTMALMNPNGWYCLRSNVNVMGGMTVKAHCKAHLASATEGVTVLGSNSENKAVTVMGKTTIELVGCK